MGIGIAIFGSVCMLAIHLGASVITCSLPTRIPPLHYLPSRGFMAQALYASDVVFLVALCFASSERARRRDEGGDAEARQTTFGRMY